MPDTAPYKEWLGIVGTMALAVLICAVLFAGLSRPKILDTIRDEGSGRYEPVAPSESLQPGEGGLLEPANFLSCG